MSKHGKLNLHPREEAVSLDLSSVLKKVPSSNPRNPITEYFSATDSLKSKILSPGAEDSEIFGLLTIGVISSVEFYLRNIFSRIPEICPISRRHIEMSPIPIGASGFYKDSALPSLISIFDHDSLAGSKNIYSSIQKCANLKMSEDKSVATAIADFDQLCELRHCLVHARGYVGLKACNALQINDRYPHKVLMSRNDVFEVLKIAHNVVRAVNRYLADSILDRWIDSGLLSGAWSSDKKNFMRLFETFQLAGQDAYSGNAYRAYLPFGKVAKLRAAATHVNT